MIDVIIPAYNTEKYLPACLESLLANETDDVRFILVDDGSTDRTGAICDDFCSKHANALAIHRENGGSPAARNAGIEAAGNHGANHWIWFVDSDDVVTPGALDYLQGVAAGSTADALHFGHVQFLDGEEPAWSPCHDGDPRTIEAHEFLSGTYSFQYDHYLCCFLFRRDALDRLVAWRAERGMSKLCGEEYSLLEDLVFVEEFMQGACKRVELLSPVLYGYRQIATSMSHSVNPRSASSALRALRYIDRFAVPKQDAKAKALMQIALLFNAYRAAGQGASSRELRISLRGEIETRVRKVALRHLTKGLLIRYIALKTGLGDLALKLKEGAVNDVR